MFDYVHHKQIENLPFCPIHKSLCPKTDRSIQFQSQSQIHLKNNNIPSNHNYNYCVYRTFMIQSQLLKGPSRCEEKYERPQYTLTNSYSKSQTYARIDGKVRTVLTHVQLVRHNIPGLSPLHFFFHRILFEMIQYRNYITC